MMDLGIMNESYIIFETNGKNLLGLLFHQKVISQRAFTNTQDQEKNRSRSMRLRIGFAWVRLKSSDRIMS
uniref:NADH-plastoquinone oxidoreductase subunit 3 n=1 Tax=Epipactis mairei TaxID=1518434 RepID=A0A2P1EP33_9ASPA|nr:NADH-plastoquinone oxidoreductase subunit 3 [Epipactis mairei]